MKVQQTFDFILISQIIIAFGAILAIFWSLFRNVNFLPFILLLLASIFIFVTVYIANNKLNKLQIDKNTCVLSIFIIWFVLIIMGAIPLYLIFPDENIKRDAKHRRNHSHLIEMASFQQCMKALIVPRYHLDTLRLCC